MIDWLHNILFILNFLKFNNVEILWLQVVLFKFLYDNFPCSLSNSKNYLVHILTEEVWKGLVIELYSIN